MNNIKDLPKVYQVDINKSIDNNLNEVKVRNNNYVSLDNILKSGEYSFNHLYNIILNDNKIIKDSIIQKTNNKILTMNNSWIYIKDIKYIEEIKNVE